MSSSNSPTLNDVIENIVEDVLRKRAKQAENQETDPTKEVKEKAWKMEGAEKEERVFLTENGAEAF